MHSFASVPGIGSEVDLFEHRFREVFQIPTCQLVLGELNEQKHYNWVTKLAQNDLGSYFTRMPCLGTRVKLVTAHSVPCMHLSLCSIFVNAVLQIMHFAIKPRSPGPFLGTTLCSDKSVRREYPIGEQYGMRMTPSCR